MGKINITGIVSKRYTTAGTSYVDSCCVCHRTERTQKTPDEKDITESIACDQPEITDHDLKPPVFEMVMWVLITYQEVVKNAK